MKNLLFLPFLLLAAIMLVVYAWWPDQQAKGTEEII